MLRPFLISVVMSLCFALFESAVLSNVVSLPAVPDFLLICTLYFSVNNGRLFGCANGFVSGLFLDFLSAAPLGLHSLVRTIIGYAAGFLNKNFNMGGIFLPLVLCALATVAKAFLVAGASVFFPLSVNRYAIFSTPFLFELSANAVLTPILFKFLSLFSRNLLVENGSVS